MLFAMTSTLCASGELPLPVYLKIYLVTGFVCSGETEIQNVGSCVFVCLCWLYKTASERHGCGTVRTLTGRTAVLWQTYVCVCVLHVWAFVCDRERNWPSTSWLYLLCWAQKFTVNSSVICAASTEGGKRECSVLLYLIPIWCIPYLS